MVVEVSVVVVVDVTGERVDVVVTEFVIVEVHAEYVVDQSVGADRTESAVK